MIPAAFDYVVPRTLPEAVAELVKHGQEAKVLAGGHSLIPLMKLRLSTPSFLVDIGRLDNLTYIREEDGHVAIGALTSHHDIEFSELQRGLPDRRPAGSQPGDDRRRGRARRPVRRLPGLPARSRRRIQGGRSARGAVDRSKGFLCRHLHVVARTQ